MCLLIALSTTSVNNSSVDLAVATGAPEAKAQSASVTCPVWTRKAVWRASLAGAVVQIPSLADTAVEDEAPPDNQAGAPGRNHLSRLAILGCGTGATRPVATMPSAMWRLRTSAAIAACCGCKCAAAAGDNKKLTTATKPWVDMVCCARGLQAHHCRTPAPRHQHHQETDLAQRHWRPPTVTARRTSRQPDRRAFGQRNSNA